MSLRLKNVALTQMKNLFSASEFRDHVNLSAVIPENLDDVLENSLLKLNQMSTLCRSRIKFLQASIAIRCDQIFKYLRNPNLNPAKISFFPKNFNLIIRKWKLFCRRFKYSGEFLQSSLKQDVNSRCYMAWKLLFMQSQSTNSKVKVRCN